jgi:hypothetical protein
MSCTPEDRAREALFDPLVSERLREEEVENLKTHLGLWRAYVHPDGNPTEMELWGAVRSVCDWLPRLLAERDELTDELERRRWYMEQAGYRRCDIPACNCNSWHGGHADQRLLELREETRADWYTRLLAERDDLRRERDVARYAARLTVDQVSAHVVARAEKAERELAQARELLELARDTLRSAGWSAGSQVDAFLAPKEVRRG